MLAAVQVDSSLAVILVPSFARLTVIFVVVGSGLMLPASSAHVGYSIVQYLLSLVAVVSTSHPTLIFHHLYCVIQRS